MSSLRPFTLPSGAQPTVPGFGVGKTTNWTEDRYSVVYGPFWLNSNCLLQGTRWYKSGSASVIDQNVIDAIESAIKCGYRHIDTAEVYGTDEEVGLAIKKSGIPRSELFVTHKIIKNISDPRKAITDALKLMQVDYFDLFLIHSPFFDKASHGITLPEAWKMLESFQKEGLCKNIGVSNFAIKDIEAVLEVAEEKIAVNQIEFNPYLQNQTPGIVDFCQSKGILVAAYTPLVSLTPSEKGGPVDSVVANLSKKYGKSDSQVILKWVIAKGVMPVTTSSKPERQIESLDLDGFELTPEEVKEIDIAGAKKHVRKYWTAEYEWTTP